MMAEAEVAEKSGADRLRARAGAQGPRRGLVGPRAGRGALRQGGGLPPGSAARDRAFARLLYTTVLRRKAAIDAALAVHLREPPQQRSAMNLLRIGAAQLIYLKTAPHAGVGESVELAKRRRLAPPGLVNAVLRKLVGQAPPVLAPLATLPAWLADRWVGGLWPRAGHRRSRQHSAPSRRSI